MNPPAHFGFFALVALCAFVFPGEVEAQGSYSDCEDCYNIAGSMHHFGEDSGSFSVSCMSSPQGSNDGCHTLPRFNLCHWWHFGCWGPEDIDAVAAELEEGESARALLAMRSGMATLDLNAMTLDLMCGERLVARVPVPGLTHALLQSLKTAQANVQSPER